MFVIQILILSCFPGSCWLAQPQPQLRRGREVVSRMEGPTPHRSALRSPSQITTEPGPQHDEQSRELRFRASHVATARSRRGHGLPLHHGERYHARNSTAASTPASSPTPAIYQQYCVVRRWVQGPRSAKVRRKRNTFRADCSRQILRGEAGVPMRHGTRVHGSQRHLRAGRGQVGAHVAQHPARFCGLKLNL